MIGSTLYTTLTDGGHSALAVEVTLRYEDARDAVGQAVEQSHNGNKEEGKRRVGRRKRESVSAVGYSALSLACGRRCDRDNDRQV